MGLLYIITWYISFQINIIVFKHLYFAIIHFFNFFLFVSIHLLAHFYMVGFGPQYSELAASQSALVHVHVLVGYLRT